MRTKASILTWSIHVTNNLHTAKGRMSISGIFAIITN